MTMLSRISRFVAAGGLLFAAANAQAMAETVGVVALYKGDKSALNAMTAGHDCSIRRAGKVLARQGNLDLPQLDRFAVLSCAESPLKSTALETILPDTAQPFLLLEGDLQEFDVAGGSQADQREYLLKLSYYTNSDPVGRSKDLATLAEIVAPLDDPYRTESFLEVHRALGLRTPDEVVTLFYDSPEAGNRFRAANRAVLEKVGAFNKAHLLSFVYLVAKAD